MDATSKPGHTPWPAFTAKGEHERLGPLQLCRYSVAFARETPAAGQVKQTVGTVIGMTDTAFRPVNPGMISGAGRWDSSGHHDNRVRIIVGPGPILRTVVRGSSGAGGKEDLAKRVRLADSFAYELTAPAVAANAIDT